MQIANDVDLLLHDLRVQTAPLVTNQRLQLVVSELYRPNPKIRPGGTAAAIIYESLTGNLVNGKGHKQKGKEYMRCLEKMLEKKNLNPEDTKTAMDMLEDLKYALQIASRGK